MASARTRKLSRTRPPHTAVANASQPVKDPNDEELRRQHRLENECAQFLRVHQKLAGRKTTAEYARIRIVRRQDEETRRRHLHANGAKKVEHEREGAKTALPVVDDQKPMARQTRPHTARDTSTTSALHHRDSPPVATRKRPQSAKQARRDAADDQDHVVAGRSVSVALLERYYYNPIPLTTHLAMSRSAPRLQAALQYATVTLHGNGRRRRAASVSGDEEENDLADRLVPPTLRHTVESHDTSGRLRIVVNMRHLEIREDEDDETESTAAKDAAPSALGQRHERSDRDSAPLVPVPAVPAGRSAWGDAD